MSGTVYIVLFRGVGGATQIPTAALRAALTAAGFGDVATYINSGNAVLSSALDSKTVLSEVADIVHTKFGFTKDIIIATARNWNTVLKLESMAGERSAG